MASVRRASPADFPAMIAMGRALALESPKYSAMGYDEAKLLALLERIDSAPVSEHACSFVVERAGALAGMMMVALAERFFSADLYVTDITLYVRPEHRGSLLFARLVQAAETWARERGVRDACFGVSTEVEAEATVHAYQRLGYRLTGYTLTKTLANGD